MYLLCAYHYNGEFAFCIDFDTEEEALIYADNNEQELYEFMLEVECPDGQIIEL